MTPSDTAAEQPLKSRNNATHFSLASWSVAKHQPRIHQASTKQKNRLDTVSSLGFKN
jgi:hypothetical protein